LLSNTAFCRVGTDAPWLLLLEHLTSYKHFIPERIHWHSTLIGHRHGLPIRSFLILLRPDADGPAMTGAYQEGFPGEPPYLTFSYNVIRIWEQSPDRLLTAGVGLAPLAPLANVEPSRIPRSCTVPGNGSKPIAQPAMPLNCWQVCIFSWL
jgi:hypothetical protein